MADLFLLVVEDDIDSRELLEMFLTGHGASVRTAASAGEARAAIRERAPDVVLMDITLPDEDGFSFIASLRADAATHGIPAIAMTGHTDPGSRRRGADVGFQRYVTKPIDLDALLGTIVSALEEAAR